MGVTTFKRPSGRVCGFCNSAEIEQIGFNEFGDELNSYQCNGCNYHWCSKK